MKQIKNNNEDLIRTLIREYTYGFNIPTKFEKVLGGSKNEGLIKTGLQWIKDALELGGSFLILKGVTWLLNKPKGMTYTDYALLSYEVLKATATGKAAKYVHELINAGTESVKNSIVESIKNDPDFLRLKPLLPSVVTSLLSSQPGAPTTQQEAKSYRGTGLTLIFEADEPQVRFPKVGNEILYSTKIGNYVIDLESKFLPQLLNTSDDLSTIRRKISNNSGIEDSVKVALQKFAGVYKNLQSAKTGASAYPSNFRNIVEVPNVRDFDDVLNDANQQELARRHLTNAFFKKGMDAWRSEILAFVGDCINSIDKSGLDEDDKVKLQLDVAEALVKVLGESVFTGITDYFTSD